MGVLIALSGLVGGILVLSLFLPGFAAGVWSPTPTDILLRMLAMAAPRRGEILVDLGCGDGRFLIEAARRYGVRTVGYEVNPFWLGWTRFHALWRGVSHNIELRRQDIFQADLSEARIVIMFLSQAAHDRMEPLLKAQLPPGARVVTYQRPFPHWTPSDQYEARKGKFIYLYIQGQEKGA